MMADPGTSGFQSLPQNPGLARYVWPRLLPAAYTVEEGIGGGGERNMDHQGKKLAGQKGEARTEH